MDTDNGRNRRRAAAAITAVLALLLPSRAAHAVPCPPLPPASAEHGPEALDSAFKSSYSVWRLPQMTGQATNAQPGGMAIDTIDPNIFYIIDDAETTATNLLRVPVARDACGHVTGWAGDAVIIASLPYADASLLHGPQGTFVFSEWPMNTIGQLQSWSSTSPPATTWTTPMGPLGVATSGSGTAGITWAPVGYTAPGTLYALTWGGDFYVVPYTADAISGKLTLQSTTHLAWFDGGPGGMTYIPDGAPVLQNRGIVLLEYDNDAVAYYSVDAAGVPDPASRVEMLNNAQGAWGGGFVDPISGDLYWAAWGGDQQIHVVSGFPLPECHADANCHATEYCSAATKHCVSKGANGQPVPSDPAHAGGTLDGTCNPAEAVLGCVSGMCNATTGTCGGANGAPCAGAGECVSNSCTGGACTNPGCAHDADCPVGKYCNPTSGSCSTVLDAGTAIPSDGLHDGTCNPTEAQEVCATGLCNATQNTCAAANGSACSTTGQCVSSTCTSGRCVPATNGCYLDADCAAGSYCGRATLICAAKLAVGIAIPSDGLHDGACSPIEAAAVCASGLCNAATSTCAAANGASCSSASQCASDACTSGRCVPAANGCYLDGDCAAGSYCNRASLTCAAKLGAGSAIPSDGLHDGACTPTEAAAVCASGLCNAVTSTCGTANGAACASAGQCVSGTCTEGHCVPSSAGCYLDVDCAAGSYCNRATLTCAAKLGAGAAIPSDGLHDGQCNATEAAAVCASGLCNAVTSTCAAANGAACSSAGQCVSGTCTEGHCVPSSAGCYLDVDCAAGSYCNRATLTCAAKLGAGSAIPSDGLHDGQCNATEATAVCASGLCNTVTSTCAAANGAACSSAGQCVSGTCTEGHCVPSSAGCYLDVDCAAGSYCNRASLTCAARLGAGSAIPSDGLHDGQCNATEAAAVCASGLCNAVTSTCAAANGAVCASAGQCASDACVSGHCVPAANGCYLDADCAAGSYCDRASLTCAAKVGAGAAIPSDGLHDGACNATEAKEVCSSGLCNAATSTCAWPNGAPCSSAGQCASDACTGGHCVPAANGCYLDADCAAGSYCNRATFTCTAKLGAGTAIPSDGLHDGKCNAAEAQEVCATGLCNATQGTCAAGPGATCVTAAQCVSSACASGHCVADTKGCYLDGDCSAGFYCDRAIFGCRGQLGVGTPIPSDGLHDGQCSPSEALAVCAGGACNAAAGTCAGDLGTACSAPSACITNTCVSGRCVPATKGCAVDGDCTAGTYCNRAAYLCVALLPPGAGLPTDGLHDGACSTALATAVCASGACNATQSTCAADPPAACTAARQCVSNACTSGHCVPAVGGCYLDSDCAAGAYCSRSSLTCVTKLASGSPLPADGLHDGTCTAALATAVCASGLCNAPAGTCATSAGSACTAAAGCVSNACTGGTCVAATNGCHLDADCPAGQFCDQAHYACTAKLAPGASLPSDGLHDGKCASALAAAACQTGQCNAATATCAAGPSSACSGAAECVSNACKSGHCVPSANGCYADSDCDPSAFCDHRTLTCAAKLLVGGALPSDGAHDGQCTATLAAAVCATSACNTQTRACALSNGAQCTADAQCAANLCGAGICGQTFDFAGGGCSLAPRRDDLGLAWLAAAALVALARRRARR